MASMYSQLIDSLPKRCPLPIRIAGRFFTGLLLAGISVTGRRERHRPADSPAFCRGRSSTRYTLTGSTTHPPHRAAYAQSWTGFTGAWEVERYDANQQFVADPNGDICAIDIYHDGRYGSKVRASLPGIFAPPVTPP